jgi:UPF0716 family protein affecting phage T7 exclusion
MELKSQIGIAVALVLIAVGLMAVVGFVLVRKNGFDGIRSMLGESELDKLISKINKFLGVE